MQGHFRLARVGDSVDSLLDVHAAARGLIQNPALRHPIAQGSACGRVPHRGQRSVIGAGSGVSLGAPVFSGAVAPFPRGAEGGHAARRRRRFRGRAARGGLWDYLQVGVRARVLLWEVPFAASESQRPDDLVCRVQPRRPGACFAWGRGFRHRCVAVLKSRGWGADFPWLVHVLWARWAVAEGARTLAPRAGVCVLVRALGALPAARVAWVAPLRRASEARRSPFSGCPPLGGCQGPPPTCCGRGCAGVGAQHCPLGLHALSGLRAARAAAVPAPAPRRDALASRRCALWGWWKGVPGGGAVRRCGERPRSGASPPLAARLLGGLLGPATRLLWARVCRRGGPALSPWLACPVGAACRGGGRAVPGRDGLLPLRGASGFRRCPSPDRPSSGPGSRGSTTRASRSRLMRAWGPSTGPTACALAGCCCTLREWRKGVPGGGALRRCEGRLRPGAPPPPWLPALWVGCRGLLPTCCERVCGCGGPALSPWLACPVGAACRGGGGGPSPGGWPATVVRDVWFRDPCVLGAVGVGMGAQHRPHALQAVDARRGGGGRASPGGAPFAVVKGV